MKKIILTEADKKQIIIDREKLIIENFSKTFNKIKRLDENELSQKPKEIKAGEVVANELQNILSPEEISFLGQVYTQGGKEVIAKAIDDATGGLNEDTNTQPPAEGEFGMSAKEIKLRQLIDKIVTNSSVASMLGAIGFAAAYSPIAIGLGIAATVGFMFKDAAWWKSKGSSGEEYPHHHAAQTKYGVEENDGEDYERQSREVEYGINPYQEQPDMDSIKLDTMKQHLEWLESMIMNYDRAMMYDKKDEVEQQYYQLRNEISNLEQGNELPF